jgi:hypothetical protein
MLEDVLLYLMARHAEVHDGAKLSVTDFHSALAALEPAIEELGITVLFHRTSQGAWSRQVEHALNNLVPFDIRYVNPRFALVLDKPSAEPRLDRLRQRLDKRVVAALDSMSRVFDDQLAQLNQ